MADAVLLLSSLQLRRLVKFLTNEISSLLLFMLADQKPFPYSSLFPPSFFCTKYYYIIEGRKHPVCIWCVCMLWVHTCAFIPTHLNFLSLHSSSIKGRRIKWENMSRYLLNCCCITYDRWYHHPHHHHGVKTNNGITFLLTDWEEVTSNRMVVEITAEIPLRIGEEEDPFPIGKGI